MLFQYPFLPLLVSLVGLLVPQTYCWLLLERFENHIVVGDELALVASYPEFSTDFNQYSPVYSRSKTGETKIQPVDSILIMRSDDESINSCIQFERDIVVEENQYYVEMSADLKLDSQFNTAKQVKVMLRYRNQVVSNTLMLEVLFKISPEMLPVLAISGPKQPDSYEYKFIRKDKIVFIASPSWGKYKEIEYYNVKLSIYGYDTKAVLEIYSNPHISNECPQQLSDSVICEWHIGDKLPGNRVMTARLSYQAIAKTKNPIVSFSFDQESSVRFTVSSTVSTPLVSERAVKKREQKKKAREAILRAEDKYPFDEEMLESLNIGNTSCINPITRKLDNSHHVTLIVAESVAHAPKLVVTNQTANQKFQVGQTIELDLQFTSDPAKFNVRNIILQATKLNNEPFIIDIFQELPASWEWTKGVHLIDWVIPEVFKEVGPVQVSIRYEAQIKNQERQTYQSTLCLWID